MKFMLSKAFMAIVGMLLLLIKFVFFADMGILLNSTQMSSVVSFTGYFISLAMFLSMIGVVVYVLSRGMLDTKA